MKPEIRDIYGNPVSVDSKSDFSDVSTDDLIYATHRALAHLRVETRLTGKSREPIEECADATS